MVEEIVKKAKAVKSVPAKIIEKPSGLICNIKQLSAKNVHQIDYAWQHVGDEKELLLTSDWHFDNTKCDRGLMKEHFDEAKHKGAGILAIGDLFCAMQGKYDKRSSKSSIRPENMVDNYLDSLVYTMAEWLEPYKEHLLFISYGNHETSVLKHTETDLLARLAVALNTGLAVSGYGGYLKLQFYRSPKGEITSVPSEKHSMSSFLIKTFHGHGGGGPVTKGVIQSQRQAVIYPDADCVVSGHVHDQYIINYPKERVNKNGLLSIKPQFHIRTATYKEEFQHDIGGWHTERGGGPKPLGGAWLKFKIKDDNGTIGFSPSFTS